MVGDQISTVKKTKQTNTSTVKKMYRWKSMPMYTD